MRAGEGGTRCVSARAGRTLVALLTALVLLVAPARAAGAGAGAPVGAPAATAVSAVSAVGAVGASEALGLINAARAALGVAPLVRHPALDAAAVAHAEYARRNAGDPALVGMGLHAETAGRPGFTGVDFAARTRAQGYQGSVNENIGVSGSLPATAAWSLDTVGHRLTLLDPRYTDIGLGAIAPGDPGGARMEVIDLGAPRWSATATPVWEQWPPDGATGVGRRFDGETPDPFPGAAYPTGYPITLKYLGPGAIVFAAAGLARDGAAVPTRWSTGTGFLTSGTAIVAATEPLAPGATYAVTVSGTVGGAPFVRTWRFTTAGTPPPAPAPTPPPTAGTPSPPPGTPVPTPTPRPLTPTATPGPAPAPTGAGSAVPPGVAGADPAVGAVWSAADGPVLAGAATRSWTWGPDVRARVDEPFVGAPGAGGTRRVWYFDKSRMELTNPNGDRASPWFVSNGLLVRELIAGTVQVGPTDFLPHLPARVTVSGDPLATNPGAVTYAALRGVTTLAPGEHAALARPGAPITATIDGAGVVGDRPALVGQATNGPYDPVVGHNVADVFWTWLTAGPVDPLYAAGRPLAEPYWTETRIGGTPTWVLVQPFERRLLTFVPGNAPLWRVESGNVGLHYHAWRYDTAPSTP